MYHSGTCSPPVHQNWRTSPELRNKDIYMRCNTQALVLQRIRLHKEYSWFNIIHYWPSVFGIEIDFCLCFSAPSSAKACLLRTFRPQRSLGRHATCGVVVYVACLAWLVISFWAKNICLPYRFSFHVCQLGSSTKKVALPTIVCGLRPTWEVWAARKCKQVGEMSYLRRCGWELHHSAVDSASVW